MHLGLTFDGWSQTETFQYTEGTDSQSDSNAWSYETVEKTYGSDGNLQSTYTVYTNYLGQTLLSDLADTSGNHTFTYYQYNDSDGSALTLEAPSSAIAGYWDGTGSSFTNSVGNYQSDPNDVDPMTKERTPT